VGLKRLPAESRRFGGTCRLSLKVERLMPSKKPE
jgi:hypothetical protein